MKASNFPALIQRFFTDRLCTQMEASRHTVAGYRDTFRLLIRYASARCGKPPTKLTIEDLDADLVADFLTYVEAARGNTARTRNTRLAAIRSFFRYVALTDPSWLLHCQRILSVPNKRYVKRSVTFLDAEEIAALLAAPDRTTWVGRRDQPRPAVACTSDRVEGFRADQPALQGCGAWHWRSHPLHRQGTKRTQHASSS
jgi:site-specific recombinase XerD